MSIEFDTRPWLILCEGETDKKFFDQLIVKRGIENDFQVRFPHRGKDKRAGRSKFGSWLSVAYENEDFRNNVKAVLVVSDNDSDPATSLLEVKKAMMEAEGFPIPAVERAVEKKAKYPSIVILMVPNGVSGSLETICLDAAYSKWAIQQHIETFTNNTAAAQWSASKQSKMKLQTIIAATCASRPDSGFAGHWWEDGQYHIPLEHRAFDDIANFLIGFRAMVET